MNEVVAKILKAIEDNPLGGIIITLFVVTFLFAPGLIYVCVVNNDLILKMNFMNIILLCLTLTIPIFFIFLTFISVTKAIFFSNVEILESLLYSGYFTLMNYICYFILTYYLHVNLDLFIWSAFFCLCILSINVILTKYDLKKSQKNSTDFVENEK